MNEMALRVGIPAALSGQPLVVSGRLSDHLAAHKHEHRGEAVIEKPKQIHDAGQ